MLGLTFHSCLILSCLEISLCSAVILVMSFYYYHQCQLHLKCRGLLISHHPLQHLRETFGGKEMQADIK